MKDLIALISLIVIMVVYIVGVGLTLILYSKEEIERKGLTANAIGKITTAIFAYLFPILYIVISILEMV